MTNNKLLFLIGLPGDKVLQHFSTYLCSTNSHIIFIDQNRIGKDIGLDLSYWHLPQLGKISHSDITAVYARCSTFQPGKHVHGIRKISNDLLVGLLDHYYSLVVNKPSAMMSNSSKPYQSYILRDLPLEFPDYFCLANAKIKYIANNIIYKSISSIRSIVTTANSNSNNFVTEPVLFQQLITGFNIRVHVIGEEIFACKITSSKIDYRYASNRFFQYNLPTKIKEICFLISKRLELPFCGIDLIFSSNKYYFLEANPSPGFNYYEQYFTGKPISKALYKLMIGV